MTEVALITGAGIGIGRAAALAFARAGYHVVVTDVLEAEGNAVVAEITATGGTAEFHRLDVRSTEMADAVVADVEARHGKIDVIVANAGIAHKVPLAEMSDEKWDYTFDIDLKGIFRIVRPALPGMKARGKGAIVALSSIMGVAYGWDEHVHYSAAKAGIIGMTKSLAREVSGQGVRVNAVAPGPINTPLVRNLSAEWQRVKAAELPLGRFGEPEEVAETVAFLCSPAAALFVGQTLGPNSGDVML